MQTGRGEDVEIIASHQRDQIEDGKIRLEIRGGCAPCLSD
jgi:hypothetical protein